MLWIALAVGLAAVSGPVLAFVYAMRQSERETVGVRYYGAPLARRRALKQTMAARGRWAVPIARAFFSIYRPSRLPTARYKRVTGPGVTCSAESFEHTERYQPDERDIFVATQMKCGTTWMQQLAYEVLMRGSGDFGDSGHVHLYATSPWIESRHSVTLEDAPRLGERGMRLIKTHMPTLLTPYSENARYLYVTRHPVACFASCVDFLRMLTGPMCPRLPSLLDWYCSDDMWWRSWPEHVEGWWQWAQERPNVLFVHYEEMLDDLPGVASQVARFLDCALTGEEHRTVVAKSRFDYMKQHEELFEMAPPNIFSETSSVRFMQSGSRERERGVGDAERQRILSFCCDRLEGKSYPLDRFYPDVASRTP